MTTTTTPKSPVVVKATKKKGGKTSSKKNGKKPVETKKKGKSKKFDEDTFYKKYPHVVSGSIKEVEVGSEVDGLKVVHPRICKIKCKETGKLRTVHVQDAWQCKFTLEVQKKKQAERQKKARKKAKKS